MVFLFLLLWAGVAAVAALGVAVAARAWRERSAVGAGAGLVLVILPLIPTTLAASAEIGMGTAALLPVSIALGTLLYVQGRSHQGRSQRRSLQAAVGALFILLSALPLVRAFQGAGWSPPSLELQIQIAAVIWPAAGLALLLLGVERLRRTTGRPNLCHRGAGGVLTVVGIGSLLVTPGVVGALLNVGA
jgi:hypothetical protein